MDETAGQDLLDVEVVKRRSVKGVILLTTRSIFLQGFALVATFLLTILLSPQEFGVFFVVSAVVNFLVYFSDIGLAASLIQKKEEITNEDLATTFTIQQGLVLPLIGIGLAASSSVGAFYALSPQGLSLLRALIVAFFLSSLKTIPSIILERRLQFHKLVFPQIAETVTFYGLALFLAWKGKGVDSFTAAVLARGVVGLFVVYLLQPWVPRFQFSVSSAKRLLTFGIPFQTNSFLALVKDDLLMVYIGKVLPFLEVGYVGWAQRWALFPLRFFSDNIIKVTFPAYTRLQHDRETLKKAVEKSIFAVATVVFPSIIGLVTIAPTLTEIIPHYGKWQPALLSLSLFGVNALAASLSTVLTNTLNAIGKIKTTLKLMVVWVILTWVSTPLLIRYLGFNGVAFAAAAVSTTSILTVYLVKKEVEISVLPQITAPLLAAFAMGAFVFALAPLIATTIVRTVLLLTLAGILYTTIITVLARKKVKAEITAVSKYLREK